MINFSTSQEYEYVLVSITCTTCKNNIGISTKDSFYRKWKIGYEDSVRSEINAASISSRLELMGIYLLHMPRLILLIVYMRLIRLSLHLITRE